MEAPILFHIHEHLAKLSHALSHPSRLARKLIILLPIQQRAAEREVVGHLVKDDLPAPPQVLRVESHLSSAAVLRGKPQSGGSRDGAGSARATCGLNPSSVIR